MKQKSTQVFDTIVIDDGTGKRKVSVAEFFNLPLPERIRLILSRKLEFLEGQREVDQKVALKSLMGSLNRSTGTGR